MASYNTWEDLIRESEQNMQQLEENKSYCFAVYDTMRRQIDSCLLSKSYPALLELLPYFNAPEAYPRLRHSGETRKIHILLNALKLELQYHKEPFVSSAQNCEELFTQYTLTIFALRRLELALSPEAMDEAVSYLTSIPFNVYIARIIIENEYFENYGRLYWSLYRHMETLWPVTDRIQWMTCLLEKEPSQNVLLELSSLYITIQCYDKAYQYLLQIPSPSPETAALIHSLKELFHYE